MDPDDVCGTRTMFSVSAVDGSDDGARQKSGNESRLKKESRDPEVTLPPLCKAALSGHAPLNGHAPLDRPTEAVKLPPLVAVAQRCVGSTGQEEPPRVRWSDDKTTTTVKKGNTPLTGAEVVQVLTENRAPGGPDLYYLKEVGGASYRPYHLRVVRSGAAGSDHYVFSSRSVLRVTGSGLDGPVGLSEWSRERLLWTALQEVAFFRSFRLRKAFTRWNRNVRRMLFRRRCEVLQDALLTAVPRFQDALLLLAGTLEELTGTPRLPLEASGTFTLLGFQEALKRRSQEFLRALQTLSRQRATILNAVKEDGHEERQNLQLHRQYAARSRGPLHLHRGPLHLHRGPLHLHRGHQRHLEEGSSRSESVLQKLGNFAALVDEMIVQSLVWTLRRDVDSLVSGVLERRTSQSHALFHAELRFAADGQLTIDPPLHRFQEVMSEALLAVSDLLIQMCDTCGLFLETSSSDLTSDPPSGSSGVVENENLNAVRHEKFCCWKFRRGASSSCPAPPDTASSLMVRGNRARVSYYPLSRGYLERQVSVGDVTRVAERLGGVMREAEEEVQRLYRSYSWLTDVSVFIDQWRDGAAESMTGQPASLYEERVKTLRRWTERVNALPSLVCTSDRLFIIDVTAVKERLSRQLKVMEQEVLELLVSQIKLRSEGVALDLEEVSAQLEAEPRDLRDLSTYALTVRRSGETLADVLKRRDYIRSLQDAVGSHYRRMTEEEATLEGKGLQAWARFIHLLSPADGVVCRRLPAASNALDTMSSFLAAAVKDVVAKATSGAALDPTQNPQEMVSALTYTCAHLQSLKAKLDQLSVNRQNLQERPVDPTVLTTDVQKVEARKELWELIAEFTEWLEERKQLVCSEDVMSQAQEKITKWKARAVSLTDVLPTHDAVLQETLTKLERLNDRLAVMNELRHPALEQKHLKVIFEGTGVQIDPEKKLTFAELMLQQVEIDNKLVSKICRDAQAESMVKQTFHKLRQGWEARSFRLDEFRVGQQHESTEDKASHRQTAGQPSCFTITDLDVHLTEVENDLMALSTVLKSPHSVDARLEMEDWVQSLQELGNLLCLFERYQQSWTFLTKMFNQNCSIPTCLEQFQPVDETFKKIMSSVTNDPCVLNFVRSTNTNDGFHGDGLCQLLTVGLFTMDSISNQMLDLLDTLCEEFPRLYFLSYREVIELLSFYATPSTLLPFVRKCFIGVRWFKVDGEVPCNEPDVKTGQTHGQTRVLGVFGSLQERITFPSPLEPDCSALVWLCVFEKQLKLTMKQLVSQCAVVGNQLGKLSQDLVCDKKLRETLCQVPNWREAAQPMLDLVSEYPLQSLLVAEEAVWCKVVLHASRETNATKFSDVKAHNTDKLTNICRVIRDGVSVSKYTMMCLCAFVQLTINHERQLSRLSEVGSVPMEFSFEWMSLMKYHIHVEDCSLKGDTDPTCYVDVLGHRFKYDYEYFGPRGWEMVHTPVTDQAVMGVLFALRSYRCGFVSGSLMSGKKTTVVQLGRALGRQVVTVQCSPTMTASVVQRMLLGALQTGAWLVLDSVDLLTQGVLSFLGHHLEHIHQYFSDFSRKTSQRLNENPKDTTAESLHPASPIVLEGKSISARQSYGCVVLSSKSYSSEIPMSLQCATRPVALTRPDYSIIAEVMLTSIGFSEAPSLSRNLVTFFDLAKDMCCLPEFLSDDQSCYLVVLQKIISASQIHLQENIRQREKSKQAEGAAADRSDLPFSRNLQKRITEKDGKETAEQSAFHNSHLSVVRGLMEETAIVKAVLSVFMPVLYEPKKVSEFDRIVKETFLIACQLPVFQQSIEEEEKNKLTEAVSEELQRKGLHADKKVLSSALTLYQTMKGSQAVILVGPTGSGKSTCYRALAGALNGLAAEGFEKGNTTEGECPQVDPHMSDSTWNSVETVVVFPNAMTHEESFGYFCEKRGWRDGAVTKVLRDSGRREQTRSTICDGSETIQRSIVKWLVMDGEPVGQPSWLDYFSTLCGLEDPFLCLSSGEKLPSQSQFKLLMEMTDLCEASPSAVTRCSLVHFSGSDLWKAVWKSQVLALSSDHQLNQGTLKMWKCLAEDLFSSTLSLIKQHVLTSAIHSGDSVGGSVYGLQEVLSCARILHALLQHFGKEVEKAGTISQIDQRGSPSNRRDSQTRQELLVRNLFLVAYIWGFSGHLHPRHWPQFSVLARQVLFACRYKIVVPDDQSVFEYFFNKDIRINPKTTPLTTSVTPKYRYYTYLLNLMLEVNQPVLLAGEPASGKTSLCKSLLSFDKPHIVLPGSQLLGSRDLRQILNSISFRKNCEGKVASNRKRPRLLLFVDDLHEAPNDVYGKTSVALETLRQTISTGEILTFDTYQFKILTSRTIKYLASCSVLGPGSPCSSSLSSRLLRLFSIFVLPSLSLDVILSIHSPQMKMWVEELHLEQNIEDVVCSIITGTKRLYDAVQSQFQPTEQKPHSIFSHHDIQKVFWGMYLWRPKPPNYGTMQEMETLLTHYPAASFANIVHLWMHECLRTFGDRLSSGVESRALVSLISNTATTHYGTRLVDELQPVRVEDPPLVYGPDASEILSSMNQQHPGGDFSYRPQSLDSLLEALRTLMDRKQEDDKGPNGNSLMTGCVLHRQRLNQLLRVLRALAIPGGHGVLIGSDKGTGRKTTVRLAAYATGYQLMEVHPENENELHEILKEAGNRVRADGVHVIVLVHEGISRPVREEVLVAMARGKYPGFHTDEELRKLVSRVTDEKASRRYRMDTWMFEKYLNQTHRKVHVFLLFPLNMSDSVGVPAGELSHGLMAQLIKALSSSCCVEVYQPWSNRSLAEVAAQCLKFGPNKPDSGSAISLSAAMVGIHQSSCRYASVLLRDRPFDPQTYMAFVANFEYFCSHLDRERRSRTNRLSSVVARLDAMNDAAAKHKEHLIRLRETVAATQQSEEDLLRVVSVQTKLLDEANQTLAATEEKLHQLEEQIDGAEEQLRPFFASGLELLNCLDPSDLEEVRRYRDPPEGVVKVMDAVCLLFNRPPGWESAKQLIGQSDFFQELEFFDRFTRTNEELEQLGRIVGSPPFARRSVSDASRACESLLRWVRVTYERCCLQRHLQVKKQLEALAGDAQRRLRLARRRQGEARRRLEEAQQKLLLAQRKRKEQEAELWAAERTETGAAALIGRLEMHDQDWRTAAQEAELSVRASAGDALILAAIVSYAGPFGPDVRKELLSKWRSLCQTGSIDKKPEDPRASLLGPPDATPPDPLPGFPIPVSEGLQEPLSQVLYLPLDAPLGQMVVKLLLLGCRRAWLQRPLLLADTDRHADRNADETSGLEKEVDCGTVVRADDPELLDKLDQAAEEGLKVLVTHAERLRPRPQLVSRLQGLKEDVRPPHPEFRLLLSSHLPVQLLLNELHPSILARVHVVDLCLGSEELQELLLTRLMQPACGNLLSRRQQLQEDKRTLEEKLMAEEDALMADILQSDSSLLQDSGFLPRVALCQEATTELRSEIGQLSEELQYHESLLAAPRQLAALAAALYRVLQQVSRLPPAGYFSLSGFITVMQDAFVVKGRPLLSCDYGPVPGGVVSEVTNQMVTRLLTQYRPCLIQSHFSVLKLLASVALLEHNQLCSQAEKMVLLGGLQDLEDPCLAPPTTPALPDWVLPHLHTDLLRLDRIPAFSGLIASLSTSPLQWREYLRYPSSTVAGAIPCPSHAHLSLIQRAVLWKTMIPDCTDRLADDMAVYCPLLPGIPEESDAPHAGNLEAFSQYLSNHGGPVILTWPRPRGGTGTSIQPLHLIHELAKAAMIPVEVVSLGVLRDDRVVLSTLGDATAAGHWLVLNDCHLLEHWSDGVLARFGDLIDSLHLPGRQCTIHACFRLWFVTRDDAPCCIPGAVRMWAVPLVCDAPWDLKEELGYSLRQATSFTRRRALSKENAELLHRCAIFHSVLLQRRLYGRPGGTCSWTQQDLSCLMEDHVWISGLCQDGAKALRFLAAQLVHGGHVLDSPGLEEVEGVAAICFGRAPPLSSVVNPSDLLEQLQDLEGRLRDPGTIDDPLALGFGADVAAETIRIKSRRLNFLLRASQTPQGSPGIDSAHLKSLADPSSCGEVSTRLRILKTRLERRSDSADTDGVPGSAVHHFLLTEWDDLMVSVSTLLAQLHHRVPPFASHLRLVSWLERRAELLSAYLWRRSASDPPGAYRLAAFRNARGFLAAVRREAAKCNRTCVGDVALHLQVVGEGVADLPPNGVYLCGLKLRGASWDVQHRALQEVTSPHPCPLPLVSIQANVRSANVKSANVGRDSASPPLVTPQLPLYPCPLHPHEEWDFNEKGGRADANTIATLALHAKLHPVLCRLRGVRVVSEL
ncbi:dynein heavy chain domain-containing protein 1 [Antennarius striatus]|uniref:dynein heavy chain domain-containing protein 1 n=1 Tax=Antennarius striatus TaxID=241820 RepID=UPI0035B407C0